MENYNERRCIDVSSNVLPCVQQSSNLLQAYVSVHPINKTDDFNFDVQSSKDSSKIYSGHVSWTLYVCSSSAGGPCKQQAGIVKAYELQS